MKMLNEMGWEKFAILANKLLHLNNGAWVTINY